MEIERKATAVEPIQPRKETRQESRLLDGALGNTLILILGLASAAIVGLFRFLPSYDYPHWIYQAHVLANFADYRQWFELQIAPIPNLGSTLFIWPFSLFLNAELSGRVVVAIYAFLTVLGFAYLVRSRNHGAGFLLLGPVLIFNYFFYNGFLSYFLGLPIVLFTIGFFERTDKLTPGRWLVLTLLSVLAFLCHLFVWFPILVYAGMAGLLSGRVKTALGHWSTQLASFVLLADYALTRTSSEPLRAVFYKDIPDKVFGLITPMLPFSRVDPFPPQLPIFPLNGLFALIVGVLLLMALRQFARSKPDRKALVLPITVATLLLIAALIPIDWFAGMRAFDKRVTFMGFALLLAAMGRYVPRRLALPVAALAVATLVVHTVGFNSTNAYLTTIHEALEEREQGASLHVVTLRNPPMYAACTPGLMNLGHGVFPLQWFPLYDVVARDHMEVETFETALLRERPESVPTVTFGKYDNRAEYREFAASLTQSPPAQAYMVIFGCPKDLEFIADIWQPGPAHVGQVVNQSRYHVLLNTQ